MTTLRGELIGSDTAIAAGIEARSTSALCRKLVEAEYAPATRLELFRGLTVALRVCAIGAAAELETDGASFRPTRRAGRTPLVRPMDAPATLATPALENRGVRSPGAIVCRGSISSGAATRSMIALAGCCCASFRMRSGPACGELNIPTTAFPT